MVSFSLHPAHLLAAMLFAAGTNAFLKGSSPANADRLTDLISAGYPKVVAQRILRDKYAHEIDTTSHPLRFTKGNPPPEITADTRARDAMGPGSEVAKAGRNGRGTRFHVNDYVVQNEDCYLLREDTNSQVVMKNGVKTLIFTPPYHAWVTMLESPDKPGYWNGSFIYEDGEHDHTMAKRGASYRRDPPEFWKQTQKDLRGKIAAQLEAKHGITSFEKSDVCVQKMLERASELYEDGVSHDEKVPEKSLKNQRQFRPTWTSRK